MKVLYILVILSLLQGCGSSLANIKKINDGSYFTIESNYTRTTIEGWGDVKWVVGLKAGKYTAIGYDDMCTYYLGEGDTVIALSQERADKYLSSGYIPPFDTRNKEQIMFAGGTGGLCLPHQNIDKQPMLFFVRHHVAAPGETAVTLGLTGVAIQQLTEGGFNYIPFGSESEFLSSLKIVNP